MLPLCRRLPLTFLALLALSSGQLTAETFAPLSVQLKWHHQFQFAGYYAAEAQGYYAAEGLQVTLLEGDAEHPPIPAVLSGRAQFGVADAGVLLDRLRGRPLVVCAAVFQHSPYVILSRRDRAIATPSDLVGARVMLSEDQGAFQFRAMLSGEGIDLAKVEIVPHSWNLADLIEGRVDAVSAYASVEPARLRALGVDPAVLRSGDYGVDFYGDTLFTTEAEIAAEPERVAAFVRASLKGWEHALAHPEELADQILAMRGVKARGMTRAQLLEEAQVMRGLVLPELIQLGHMNPARWRHIAETLVAQGLAPRNASLDGFLYDPEPQFDATRLWWIAGLAGACLAGIALVALWNIQVRRRVALRTRELRAQIQFREAAEAQLRTSEERFRQIAENIHEVFWMTLPARGGLLYVSPAFERIWGRDTRTLYEEPGAWLASIHPEDRDRVASAVSRQAEGNYDELYRIVKPDGTIRWIHDRAYPIRDGEGTVYRIVGTAEDVTERRRIENLLLRAQRLESLGTLAGGIAHDLNNLLAPILMGVELIRQGTAEADTQGLAATIESSAKRGTELVQQILAFARGTESARSPVEVSGLVRELRAILDSSFPKSIVLESRVASDAWPIAGDAAQLGQVLLNLAVNARDAMPSGGRITIVTQNVRVDAGDPRHTLASGPYLLLEISDNGTGIPAAILDRIFDPFFTTKEVGKGSGLGLSTVSSIVRNHGGHIDVESRHGSGATFRIYLPALEGGAEPIDEPVDEPIPGVADDALRGRHELILVVDDEKPILRLAQRILENAGYRVTTAENGAAAASVFLTHQREIALVLTDLMMPVMDGVGLITALRKLAPQLRILGTSGNLDDAARSDLRDLGVDQVLAKPYSSAALLKAIQVALAQSPAAREAGIDAAP